MDNKISLTKDEIKYLELLTQVFGRTEAGKKLLKIWEEKFIGQPCIPSINEFSHYPDYYVYLREGQNSFIRQILVGIKMFESLEKGEPNDE